jgi:flagellar biogenesis protein FliO
LKNFSRDYHCVIVESFIVNPGVLLSLADVQCGDGTFLSSLCTVLIFLSVLSIGGYIIVQLCKSGGFIRKNAANSGERSIRILDNKFLYGRKYITLIECCDKRLLLLVTRDDAVKLSEWEIKADEGDR